MKFAYLIHLTIASLFMLPAHADEFRVLDFGNHTIANDSPWIKVIADQTEWESFYYDELYGCSGMDFLVPVEQPDPCTSSPPDIDFEISQVIVGGLGAKPSGAYSILISDVDSSGDEHRVNIVNYQAEVGVAIITYPMAAVVVKKTDKPLMVYVENASVVQ